MHGQAMKLISTDGWQSEERDGEHGETRRDDLSHPRLWNGVAVADRRHRYLNRIEYFIHQHRYNTVITVKSRTVSTGQKGSKSTYNCPKTNFYEETHCTKTKH